MTFRRYVDRIVKAMLIILMTILVLDVLWQVASRYLLKDPSSFTDELAGFLLIWVSLLGSAWAVGEEKHLAIDYFVQKFAGERRRKFEIAQGFFIILFCCVVMVIGGSWLVYTRFHLGQVSPALELPIGYMYSVVPLSGVIMIYYTVDNLMKRMK